MAELILHDIDISVIAKLKERADKHCRSVEDEHRAILHEVLLGNGREAPALSFEEFLLTMPDVGTDADFSRIKGAIRDASLSD